MARTLLATLPAAALALRATRTTVSMHTNIFPTFTIKDKAAVLGQRPIQAAAAGFFFCWGFIMHVWCCCGCVQRAAAAARAGGHRPDARRRAAAAVH